MANQYEIYTILREKYRAFEKSEKEAQERKSLVVKRRIEECHFKTEVAIRAGIFRTSIQEPKRAYLENHECFYSTPEKLKEHLVEKKLIPPETRIKFEEKKEYLYSSIDGYQKASGLEIEIILP